MNSLAHNEVQGLFSAYVDHELPPPELEKFVAHVESCDDCLEGLEHFEATVDAVRGVARERVPNSFARQVMRRVRSRNRRQLAVRPFLDGAARVPAEAIIPILLAAAIALLFLTLR